VIPREPRQGKWSLPRTPKKLLGDYDRAIIENLCERFGTTLEEVSRNKVLADVLKSKIDSDVFVAELKAQLAKAEAWPVGVEQRLQQLNATVSALIKILTAQVASKGK